LKPPSICSAIIHPCEDSISIDQIDCYVWIVLRASSHKTILRAKTCFHIASIFILINSKSTQFVKIEIGIEKNKASYMQNLTQIC